MTAWGPVNTETCLSKEAWADVHILAPLKQSMRHHGVRLEDSRLSESTGSRALVALLSVSTFALALTIRTPTDDSVRHMHVLGNSQLLPCFSALNSYMDMVSCCKRYRQSAL